MKVQSEGLDILFLRRIRRLIVMYWRQATFFVVLAWIGTVAQHKLNPKFVAVSTLHVKTPEDSSLLSMVGRASGIQWNPYSSVAPSAKYIKILESENFYTYALNEVKKNGTQDERVLNIKKIYNLQDRLNWEQDFIDRLYSNTSFKGRDDFLDIRSVETTLNTAVLSSRLMMNFALKFISEYEGKEVEDAESYLKSQQVTIQERIDKMSTMIDVEKGEQFSLYLDGFDGSGYSKVISKLREEEYVTRYKLEETERLLKKFTMIASKHDRELSEMQNKKKGVDSSYEVLQFFRGRLPDRIKQLMDDREVLRIRLESIAAQIKKMNMSIRPKAEQKIAELKRKIDLENTFFQQLQKQRFENRVYQISIDNRVSIYEIASFRTAGREVALPQKIIVVTFFALVSLALGILMMHKLFPRIAFKKDLQNMGIKVIGVVPDMNQPSGFRIGLSKLAKKNSSFQVHNPFVRSHIATSFQLLGTKVIQQFLRLHDERRGVISVISHLSGEGKTTVSTNLAVYFGSHGFKTVLIHADWLKQHNSKSIISTEHKNGIVDYLLSKTDKIEDILCETDFKNVKTIETGKLSSNSGQYIFDESKYHDLISILRKQFDIIIVDTPAMQAGLEALELSTAADLKLVIARAHKTEFTSMAELIETLNAKGLENVHAILNSADSLPQSLELYGQAYLASSGVKSA